MKRIVLFLFASMPVFAVHAQSTNVVQTNARFVFGDYPANPLVLTGTSAHRVYASYLTVPEKLVVYAVSDEGQPVKKREFKRRKIGGEKRRYLRLVTMNDKVYVMYYARIGIESKHIYYAQEIDPVSLEPSGNPKRLFDYTYNNYYDKITSTLGMRVLTYKGNCVGFLFSTADPRETTVEMHVKLVDRLFNLVVEYNTRLDPKSDEIRQEMAASDGSFYFLFHEYTPGKKDMAYSPVKILRINSDGTIKTGTVTLLDKDMTEARLVENHKGEIILAGYCAGEGESGITHTFNAVLDKKTFELNHVKVIPIAKGEPSFEETKAGFYYYLKDVLVDSSDNVYLLGENYTERLVTHSGDDGSWTETFCTYGDALVTCMKAGKLEANSTLIVKNQPTTPSAARFSSFFTKPLSNGVALMYNEGDAPVIYKEINVNAEGEKKQLARTCAMEEYTGQTGYTCRNRMITTNTARLKDGTVVFTISEQGKGNWKRVCVWK